MKHNISLSTPRRSPRRHEATTRKKVKFFEVVDNYKDRTVVIIVV